jgi:GT2 family glycosyltransferase
LPLNSPGGDSNGGEPRESRPSLAEAPRPALADVIVVDYKAGPVLRECLGALRAQTFRDFRVFVIDNGSADETFDRCREDCDDPRFEFHRFDENLGFARANNVAATLGRAPWIVTLNPDAVPEAGWLAALIEAAERSPEASMFGSTQIDAGDPTLLDGVGDGYFAAGFPWRGGFGRQWPVPDADYEVFGACAAAAMYRREVFEALGGFDERFFCCVEDTDLAFRWRLAGNAVRQARRAVVRHVGGVSQSGTGGAFARYYGTRNLIWAFIKNMPPLLFWPLLPCHLAALLVWWSRAALGGDAGPVWRGIVSAMKYLPEIWQARRAIQSRRRAGTLEIARALTWAPWTYARRAPAILSPNRAEPSRMTSLPH